MSARALAAAHDQQRFFVGGCRPGRRAPARPPVRGASAGWRGWACRSLRTGRGAGKYLAHSANPSSTRPASRALKRLALPGMAFDSWTNVGKPCAAPGEEGRGGSKAAHAQHRVRFEVAIIRRQRRMLTAKPRMKPAMASGEHPRQADGRQSLEAELPDVIAHGQGIDFLLGNEAHGVVAALVQHLRHRQPGEEVAAGASACNDHVHEPARNNGCPVILQLSRGRGRSPEPAQSRGVTRACNRAACVTAPASTGVPCR